MRQIVIDISEPDENGCIQIATSQKGKIELFEMVGILECVKGRMHLEKCSIAPRKTKKKK